MKLKSFKEPRKYVLLRDMTVKEEDGEGNDTGKTVDVPKGVLYSLLLPYSGDELGDNPHFVGYYNINSKKNFEPETSKEVDDTDMDKIQVVATNLDYIKKHPELFGEVKP